MNKMKTLFITLLCMGAGTLSAQTADSTQTSPWTKEGAQSETLGDCVKILIFAS